MKLILWGILLIIVLCALWLVWVVPKLWTQLSFSKELVDASERFTITSEAVDAPWVLVVGDSTGVGVGASSPDESVAGLLAADMGEVVLLNRSQNGATWSEVVVQLENESANFDLIIVLAGANDVLRFRSISDIQADADRALSQAARLSDHVFVLPAGNIGNLHLWPAPLNRYFTYASGRLHEMLSREVLGHDAVYVNVYRAREDDLFAREPETYLAKDGLHPSSQGYALWFDALRAKIASRTGEFLEGEEE